MQRLVDLTQQEEQSIITGPSTKCHTGDRNQLCLGQVREKPVYSGFFHVQDFTPRFVQNQQGERKLGRSDGRATRAPEFLAADHTQDDQPHWHIMFRGIENKSAGKIMNRIIQYLGLSGFEQRSLYSSLQKVHDIDTVLLNLSKYGTNLMFGTGVTWQQQLMRIDNIPKKPLEDCLNIDQAKRALTVPQFSNDRIKTNRIIKSMLKERCQPPYSWKAFLENITEDEEENIMGKLGPNHHPHTNDLITHLNRAYKRELPPSLEGKLQVYHANKPPTSPSVLHWLTKLFEKNSIDPAQLWNDIQNVADKKLVKRNALVLRGPTNCFKSQLFRLLLQPLNIVPMTRSGNQNHFWLQSLLDQDFCLWEEPMITKNNAQDWKLILEGAPIKVCVKNQPDEILERTPFFITTNHSLGNEIDKKDSDALEERYIEYYFHIQIDNDKVQGRFPACPQMVMPQDLYRFFCNASSRLSPIVTDQKQEKNAH